jgi:hypothetical protein
MRIEDAFYLAKSKRQLLPTKVGGKAIANKKVKKTRAIFREHAEVDWDAGQCPQMALCRHSAGFKLCGPFE